LHEERTIAAFLHAAQLGIFELSCDKEPGLGIQQDQEYSAELVASASGRT
jgi:hypothetical protein